MKVRVRANGLKSCCHQTIKGAIKLYHLNPRDRQTVLDCNRPTCANRMWFNTGAWEWFSYKSTEHIEYETLKKRWESRTETRVRKRVSGKAKP